MLALEELDAVDLLLDLARGPHRAEHRLDCTAVGGDAVGQPDERRELAAWASVSPGGPGPQVAAGDQAPEALEQVVTGGEFGVAGERLGEGCTFHYVELLRRPLALPPEAKAPRPLPLAGCPPRGGGREGPRHGKRPWCSSDRLLV